MSRVIPRCTPSRLLLALATLVASLAALPVRAVVFEVDSADDTNDADPSDPRCRDLAGRCTLRAAIEQANALAGLDRVEFSIPSLPASPVIALLVPLPITDEVVVDGYTQPGASPNTLALGTNAVVEVYISPGRVEASTGIIVSAPNVVLRGLNINGFGIGVFVDGSLRPASGSRVVGNHIEYCQTGVMLESASAVRVGGPGVAEKNRIGSNHVGIHDLGSGNFIRNNLIGTDGSALLFNAIGIYLSGSGSSVTDNLISGNGTGVQILGTDHVLLRNRIGTRADGQAALSTSLPGSVGILVQSDSLEAHNRIGWPALSMANANLISGNEKGIVLSGLGGGNFVQGNYLGTGAGGSGAVPNTLAAIEIVNSDANVIGAPFGVIPTHEGNVIAHTQNGTGIGIPFGPEYLPAPQHNTIRANRIFDNLFDIDLGQDFLINDDLLDADLGPNGLQNPPRIQSVSVVPGQTRLSGAIDVPAGDYLLDFYSSPACDALPDTGRGEFYLGKSSLTAAPTASALLTPFDVTLDVLAPGQGFSAIATSPSGDSSELGPCFQANLGGEADLGLEISLSGTSFDPGDPIDVKVTVHNAGPQSATDVPVQIPRPSAIASWGASVSQGSFDTTSNSWSVGDLPSGGSATLDLAGSIDAGAAGAASIEASADQGLSERDPELGDNRSRAEFSVRSGADLVVTQSPALQSGPPGTPVAFEVTVANLGPDTAESVTLTGVFEPGLALAPSAPQGLQETPSGWTANVRDLAEGDSVTVHIPAIVSSAVALPSRLLHSASASSATNVDPSPDLASSVVGAPVVADLAVVDLRFVPLEFLPYRWEVTIDNYAPEGSQGSGVGGFLLRYSGCGNTPLNTFCLNLGVCQWECPVDAAEYPATFSFDGPETQGVSAEVVPRPGDPYYDPVPGNDRMSAFRVIGYGGCGLLGIEAPLLLGLVALARGRRGRRALRRLWGGGAALLAVAFATGVGPDSASAAALSFAVDGAASSATLSLATPLGTAAPAAVTLSGSVDADVALAGGAPFGLHATSLRFTGGSIAFSDTSIPLESFPLYSIEFASQGLGATLSGPTATGLAVALGLSLFDVFGSTLRLDTGSVGATGTYYGLPVNETLDLASFPFTSFYPLNSVAQARVVDLGAGQASVALRVPFSALFRLSVEDTENTLTLAGTLALNGQVVPEPAAGLLLAAGLVGMGVAGRPRHPTASPRA